MVFCNCVHKYENKEKFRICLVLLCKNVITLKLILTFQPPPAADVPQRPPVSWDRKLTFPDRRFCDLSEKIQLSQNSFNSTHNLPLTDFPCRRFAILSAPTCTGTYPEHSAGDFAPTKQSNDESELRFVDIAQQKQKKNCTKIILNSHK